MTTAQETTLTVSDLAKRLSEKVEPFFYAVSVSGEVTNITRQTSGHLYFAIKDERAQLNVVMFKSQAMQLTKLPKAGDKVTLKGSVKLYALRSVYQLVAYTLTFAGMGDALIELQKRKEKFEKLGWFSSALKKPLPAFPKKIGIVTSPTGAAIRDILQIMQRRHPFFHAIIYPALVQGEKAASEVAKGITVLSEHSSCDVIIVARGGGSFEDLYAFNEEIVIMAAHRCKTPLISAVGHETDTTLIDFVSDKREPTPSAAAAAVCHDFALLIQNIKECFARIHEKISQLLLNYQRDLMQIRRHPCFAKENHYLFIPMQALDSVSAQIHTRFKHVLTEKKHNILALSSMLKTVHVETALMDWKNRLIEKRHLLTKHPAFNLTDKNERLIETKERIEFAMTAFLKERAAALTMTQKHLSSLGPLSVLDKGYAIALDEKTQSAIIDAKVLTPGDTLTLKFSKGSATVQVMEVQ